MTPRNSIWAKIQILPQSGSEQKTQGNARKTKEEYMDSNLDGWHKNLGGQVVKSLGFGPVDWGSIPTHALPFSITK